MSSPEKLDDLIIAFLVGYRRFERKPIRSYVDVPRRQVHFDITEIIQEEPSTNSPKQPFVFTSIKESVTDKKRYILKHEIFGNQKYPYEEEAMQTTYPWVFDASWRRVKGHISAQIQELKKAFLEGKPATLLLNSKVSTDIILAFITPEQIFVALTPFVYPFKGEESMNEKHHEIHFPLYETSTAKLVTCASSSVNGGGPLRVADTTHENADWSVSTKTWTKLYEVNDTHVVTHGTIQSLKQAVEGGNDIRVCVEMMDDLLFCFNSPLVISRLDSDEVLLQSYPSVNPFELFNGDMTVCPRQSVLLVSSKGWIDATQFSVGAADVRPVRMPFKMISWFAQLD